MLSHKRYKAFLGYGLWLLYVLVAFALRNNLTFVDEGANLDVGVRMVHGSVLYRDLFHNHMPLDALVGVAMVVLSGSSLNLVRVYILLLSAAAFLWLLRLGRKSLSVGFAAVLWALVGPFYFSNMLLYDTFSAWAAVVMGGLTYAALSDGLKISPGLLAALTASATVLVLSSPFSVLSVLVVVGSLWVAREIPKRFVLHLVLAVGACLTVVGLWLIVTGSARDFYEQVVVFNTTTYQRYAPLNLRSHLVSQLALLDLFNRDWRHSFSLLPSLAEVYGRFDQWVFSGGFFRVAALLTCLSCVLRKKYLAAVFVYGFVATLALRSDQGFHSGPMVLFCLFLAGDLLEAAMEQPLPAKLTVFAVCGIPAFLLVILGCRFFREFAFHSDFAPLQEQAQRIQSVAQNRNDVRLGAYPSGAYLYYLTGLQPASRFVEYYPSIAADYRAEMDRSLERADAEQRLVLLLDRDHDVWGVPNLQTLRTELSFAKQHLVEETIDGVDFYVSSALAVPAYRAPAQPTSSQAGVYRQGGLWVLDADGSHGHPKTFTYGGSPGDIPVTGDWGGTGRYQAGIYRPSSGQWRLDFNGNRLLNAEDKIAYFGGLPGDIPVVGDWNGSGTSKIGIFRNGYWILDYDGDGVYDPRKDKTFSFGGVAGDLPVTGDWNGDGKSKIGVFRAGEWILDANGNGRFDGAGPGLDLVYWFGGVPGDIP